MDRGGARFLPDPEVLENYNYVIEGSGERILAMIEAEQKHRHEWENRALRTHAASQVMGIVAALIVMVGVVMCTTFLAATGKEAAAIMVASIGFGVVGFALLVNVLLRFAYRDNYNRKRPQERQQNDRKPREEEENPREESQTQAEGSGQQQPRRQGGHYNRPRQGGQGGGQRYSNDRPRGGNR